MFKIKDNVSNELIIKNSKFIGLIYYVDNIEKIENILESLRNEHKDATHICFAYRLENKEKYSDDGEPTGTAGAPIMEVIKKNDITNVLGVVIRYFGGIKLGAGGLIRAYSKTIRETLNKTLLEPIIFYNYYELETNYDNLKLLNTLTSNLEITNKDFSVTIKYQVKIEKDKDNINDIFKNTNILVKKLDN